MNENQSMKDTLKEVNQGRGRKVAYLIGAVAAVGIVVGVMITSTRGTDIEESSAAMVEAVPAEDAGASPSDAE